VPTFRYAAIDLGTGRESRGVIECAGRSQATAQLRARGLAPTEIEQDVIPATLPTTSAAIPGPRRGWRWLRRPAGRRQRLHFTRQLASLVNAGVPVTRSLEILGRQEQHPVFRQMLDDLAGVISAGGSLSDGLAQHPRSFDRLYVNMVKAGEAGGALGPVLGRMADFLEKTERLRGRVKAAMIYPVIIMTVAAAILTVLLTFVVPKFQQIFTGLLRGQPLPALTRGLIDASALLRSHALLAGGLVAVAVWVLALACRTAPGARVWDRLLLRVPVMGGLLLRATVARFARTLGSLLTCGVPIVEALAITEATSGNGHVAAALGRVRERIKQGEGFARTLEATGLFPAMVSGMIQVGEETGALAEMLGRIADAYEEEVDQAVAGLTSIIEPVMVVLMAVVVGTIVLALFLPIVGVIQHLQ